MTSTRHLAGGGWLIRLIGLFLLLAGLPLIYMGWEALSLNDSYYFFLAGIGVSLTGLCYLLRLRLGAWIYLLVYLMTLVWALWEVGFNFYAQLPRLVAPTILAIIICLTYPFIARRTKLGIAWSVALVLMIGIGLTGWASFYPHGGISGQAEWQQVENDESDKNWAAYGRTIEGTRYAPFTQINRDNVDQLQEVWRFRTGDIAINGAEDQNTPLIVDNVLYHCTPHNIVHALDVDSGELLWKFDPEANSPVWQRCRGVSYYAYEAPSPVETAAPEEIVVNSDPALLTEPPIAPTPENTPAPITNCPAGRIVMTTIDARLMQLNAETGALCTDFGNLGVVDLKTGMGEVKPGFYYPTSAPTVAHNLIIVGGWVWDNVETGEPSGAVRAFDARNGALVWTWDLGNPNITTLPSDGETYTRGTPNVWSTPAVDLTLGTVFLPTGNETPDFFGAHRSKASEDYASSIVAVDLYTGREKWRFQTVHHDLWDYDVPAQPALYDLPDGQGGTVPALIQLTKRGQIFVLDRRTGAPLTDVVERPVPQQGGVAEDFAAPTQPYSTGMPAIGAETLTRKDMWGTTPYDLLYCRNEFAKLRYDGEFTLPGTTPSLQYPGFYGGMNWGSASIDPHNGLLIVNDIRMPQKVQLIPRSAADQMTPSQAAHEGLGTQLGTPYGALKTGFMSFLNVPCHQPPYGTITAIDLNKRQIVWQKPLGTVMDSGPLGLKTHLPIPVGMPTLGGPVTTAGGLIFYAGTQDYYLRALDIQTGEELWKGRLPVGAQATPATFISSRTGRQYIAISASGARQRPDRGDYIIVYALPE